MNMVPSILMITWNRHEYFARTIAHVLSDPSDFRLYLWDNGSIDGVRDIISDLRDDRIQMKHYNQENLGQPPVWHWFLENCRGDICGKLDDDILGEHGWMTRFSRLIAEVPQIGVLGAWIFLPSEWDEFAAQHKIISVGEYRVFQNCWVAGCIMLARLALLKKYSSKHPSMKGVPLHQAAITRAGFISGFPLPISLAHNLDDPRSSYCRMNRPGGWDEFAAYTARIRNFSGPEEYGRWIAADARRILETPVSEQVRLFLPTPMDRFRTKARNGARKLAGCLRRYTTRG
jgi:glycosyltransferase involved in cell wall biosynthesis